MFTRIALCALVSAVALFGCDKKADDTAKKDEAPAAAKKAEAPKKVEKKAETPKKVEKKVEAPAAAAPAGPIAPAAEVEAFFKTRCATCHGFTGIGDGVAGKSLPVKPRNWTDAAWQTKTSNERIKKVIVGGGPAAGLSPLMPPNADLKANEAMLNGLVQKIRAFKK